MDCAKEPRRPEAARYSCGQGHRVWVQTTSLQSRLGIRPLPFTGPKTGLDAFTLPQDRRVDLLQITPRFPGDLGPLGNALRTIGQPGALAAE